MNSLFVLIQQHKQAMTYETLFQVYFCHSTLPRFPSDTNMSASIANSLIL